MVPHKKVKRKPEGAETANVKLEPAEQVPPSTTDASVPKGPTILSAEEYTHGGVRKAKFEPKAPARRQKKPITIKSESAQGGDMKAQGGDGEIPSEIMKLIKQSQEDAAARGARRADIRAPVRVAFGFGSSAGGRAATKSHKIKGNESGGDRKPSIKGIQRELEDGLILEDKKESEKNGPLQGWDLSKYYPVTLPLKEPGSIEREDEFNAQELDENAIPAADELGLMRETEEERILFFQLPSLLPLSNAALMDIARASDASSSNSVAVPTSLNKLPAGYMGKLQVYSSGAVKLQLGDTIMDAVAGSQCVFAQELSAVNAAAKHCCFLGDVHQRVILVPSMDDVLEDSCNEMQ